MQSMNETEQLANNILKLSCHAYDVTYQMVFAKGFILGVVFMLGIWAVIVLYVWLKRAKNILFNNLNKQKKN